VEFTSTPPILHPEKIPTKKSKAQDGMKVGRYYYYYFTVSDSVLFYEY
jgi:hypothetical protein